MAKKVFSLLVEDGGIKLLLTKGREIEKWTTIPLTPGMVSSGVIMEEDRVATLLRQQMKTLGMKAKRVIVGLSSMDSLFRLVSFPELPVGLLPEAVRREAEKVMPVSLSEFYLAYKVIPKSPGEIYVLMVAYSRDATDRMIKMVRKAGLVPVMMDLAPLALCRTVDVPRAIVLNAQANRLDIAVISDKLPQIIRSISVSGDPVSLPSRLDAISEEIERTVAFFNSSHPNESVAADVPLYAYGDLLESPGAEELMANKLGHPVLRPKLPFSAPAAFDPAQYMVNVGLATKELMPGYSAVNFDALPERYRPSGLSMINIAAPVGIAVGLAAIAFVIYLNTGTSLEIQTLHTRINVTQSRINAEQKQMDTVRAQTKQLQDSITPLEATASTLNAKLTAMATGRVVLAADLANIQEVLPTSLVLTGVNAVGGRITVNGSTLNSRDPSMNDFNDIYVYAKALRSSGNFAACLVSSVEQVVTTTTTAPPPDGPPDALPTVVTAVSYDFVLALQ